MNKKSIVKTIIIVLLSIALLGCLSFIIYDKIIKSNVINDQNNSTSTSDKAVQITKIELSAYVIENDDPEQKKLTLTSGNEYNKWVSIINGLKLSDEKLPEGIGFGLASIVTVYYGNDKTEYIVLDNNEFAVLNENKIYKSNSNIESIKLYLNDLVEKNDSL